jgi:hypothetical protein
MFNHVTTTQIKKKKFTVHYKHNFDFRLACSLRRRLFLEGHNSTRVKRKGKIRTTLFWKLELIGIN